MTRPSATVRRVLIATALCGVLGYVAAPFVLRMSTRDREPVQRMYTPLVRYLFETYERTRCEADPMRWSMEIDHGQTVFAYDAATLDSRNPAAPALDRAAWTRSADGELGLDTNGLGLATGGNIVYVAEQRGPCAILQINWPAQPVRGAWKTWLPLGLLLAALIAVGIGFFALARPLVRVERHRAELQRHLADVAHDLKTPISSLHLALEQAITGTHDPEVSALLGAAMNDAVYLAALTSNLRLASEMRDGWNPGESDTGVDLTDVVDRVVTRAQFFARQRGVQLEVAVPDAATPTGCDPIAAEQAVSNIVENAITHGERGGHVAVVLQVSPAEFSLTVTDDGNGVPPGELPRLGERTFRTDEARQRDPTGSGLGLAITNEVCRRCGWTLSFERESPHGLRVAIRGAIR